MLNNKKYNVATPELFKGIERRIFHWCYIGSFIILLPLDLAKSSEADGCSMVISYVNSFKRTVFMLMSTCYSPLIFYKIFWLFFYFNTLFY